MLIELIRLVVTLGFTGLGFVVGREIPGWSSTGVVDPDVAIVLGTVIGAGVGYVLGGLLGRGVRRGLDRAPQLVARASGPQLFAGTFGLVAGLLVGVVGGLPLVFLTPTVIGWPTAALLVLVLAAFGARVFAARAHDLLAAAGLRSRTAVRRGPSGGGYLIDSAAAIDGRVLELARAGILTGEVWVPEFVIDELQGIADSGSKDRRRRGRRGLEVLEALRDVPAVELHTAESDLPGFEGVDAKLLALCQRSGSTLVSTDSNLARRGRPARGGGAQSPGPGRGAASPAPGRRPAQPEDRAGGHRARPGSGLPGRRHHGGGGGRRRRTGADGGSGGGQHSAHRPGPHGLCQAGAVIVHGILVAAGRGERFGGPKHTALLRGRPLWAWAEEALRHGGVDRVVLVGDLPGGVPGGARRRDSVRAGLAALPAAASHVLVHDAARPLATPDLVRRVIDRLLAGGVDAVVPVVPVRDTLKRVGDGWVIETVERRNLAGAQTPQGFKVEVLRAAHEEGDEDAGDDALLVERIGGSVATVEGEAANLKVTFPGDLALAEAWLP